MSLSSPLDDNVAAELMAKFAITRAQAAQYRYRNWRYSNLRDAVAQAERDASPS